MTSSSDRISVADELRRWAYSEDPEPQQDFDLAITGLGHEKLFLAFVEDEACPKRDFFLACLYLFVGDAVRTDYQSNSSSEVNILIASAEVSQCDLIQKWRHRSLDLISNPESFDYDQWCGGGIADEADT